MLVVGATGNVGAATARALVERGIAVRCGVPDPARAPRLAGAEPVELDLFRPSTFGPAVHQPRGAPPPRRDAPARPRPVLDRPATRVLRAEPRRRLPPRHRRRGPHPPPGRVAFIDTRDIGDVEVVAVQTVLHTGLRRGDAEVVDPTLPRLLGRPARTIEQYVREHAPTWQRDSP